MTAAELAALEGHTPGNKGEIMVDPFRLTGPALISFSGGRTSGFMLWRALQAHGGTLPDGVHVVFANTGKERPETLEFIQNCALHWSVTITWVEWRTGRPGFEVVEANSASRNGEPFEALIKRKKRPPNWMQRYCTQVLKVQTMTKFARSHGFRTGGYAEMIGLRADEMDRVVTVRERSEKDGRTILMPLVAAGVRKPDVKAFWASQPFDLRLRDGEGNCDLCFLKGQRLRAHLMRERPADAAWWIRMERDTGGFFDRRARYSDLARQVRDAGDLFGDPAAWDFDVECGLWCGPILAPDEAQP